jgi:hypothetical protein
LVTCSHLVRAVWGIHSENRLADLRVLVTRLRQKLRVCGEGLSIRTEGSLGYTLVRSAGMGDGGPAEWPNSVGSASHVRALRRVPNPSETAAAASASNGGLMS